MRRMVCIMKERIKRVGKRIGKDLWDYRVAVLVFALYYVAVHLIFDAFCPSVILTGFPCAGCGMTRAVWFLLTGQFERSWRVNPMALPVVLLAAYGVIQRYFLRRKIKGWKLLVGILCVGMLAAYIYRMVTVFPNRPPYVYTTDNFLERSIPFYRDMLHKLLGI